MAFGTTPVYPQVPQCIKTTFTAADTTVAKTIYTAGANGSKIKFVGITANAVNIGTILSILNGGTNFQLGVTNWNSGPGTSSIQPSINAFGSPSVLNAIKGIPKDADMNGFLTLVSGDSLQMAMNATIGSGTVFVVVFGVDF